MYFIIHSSKRLVFGKNPNIPTVTASEPSALEGVSLSELIADHLNCMHTAREAFTESEALNKLRRALLWKLLLAWFMRLMI